MHISCMTIFHPHQKIIWIGDWFSIFHEWCMHRTVQWFFIFDIFGKDVRTHVSATICGASQHLNWVLLNVWTRSEQGLFVQGPPQGSQKLLEKLGPHICAPDQKSGLERNQDPLVGWRVCLYKLAMGSISILLAASPQPRYTIQIIKDFSRLS